DDKIYVNDEDYLQKWLKKQMKIVFEERLNYCYNLFEEDIPFPKLKTRKMKTRWGVCNKRDLSVTLNSKLIRYDQFIIDYVIIHELSHLVHFDHSREFWDTVGKYMPDYKKAEKVLKE
ncbi:MAG: M48 family metallopeptidase, partial [Bacilli bacterium]|nr:M48 family metallopeptidase [Bacilli bacterium]